MTADLPDRLCSSCQQFVSRVAVFCEHCGARLDLMPPSPPSGEEFPEPATPDFVSEFEGRETRRMIAEMFNRHLALLKDYRKRLRQLERHTDEIERRLANRTGEPHSLERSERIQSDLEALEAIGDHWEELQLSYNQESEALDEEFLDRFAELELDVDLPEDLRDRIDKELTVMNQMLDRTSERLTSLGALGNGLIARAAGKWVGGETTNSGSLFWPTLAWSVAVAGPSVWARFAEGLPWLRSASFLVPGLIAWLLFLWGVRGRRRS